MELFTQNEDIRIICTTAKSFPAGIKEAFATLESALPEIICKRPFFGISKPNEKGAIIYKAGVLEEELGEATRYGFETFVLQKGTYLSEMVNKWEKAPQLIGETFQRLLQDKRLDPSSYCIECYKGNEDVMCMVKLKSE